MKMRLSDLEDVFEKTLFKDDHKKTIDLLCQEIRHILGWIKYSGSDYDRWFIERLKNLNKILDNLSDKPLYNKL